MNIALHSKWDFSDVILIFRWDDHSGFSSVIMMVIIREKRELESESKSKSQRERDGEEGREVDLKMICCLFLK